MIVCVCGYGSQAAVDMLKACYMSSQRTMRFVRRCYDPCMDAVRLWEDLHDESVLYVCDGHPLVELCRSGCACDSALRRHIHVLWIGDRVPESLYRFQYTQMDSADVLKSMQTVLARYTK